MADSQHSGPASAIPQNPSRRVFLAAGSAGAVFGALSKAAAWEAEAEIFRLGRELEQAHIERLSFDPFDPAYDEAADEANYNLHWSLRERIDAFPARSIKELSVKARAAKLAFEGDPECDCDGTGSFVSLSHSIIRDLAVLTA